MLETIALNYPYTVAISKAITDRFNAGVIAKELSAVFRW